MQTEKILRSLLGFVKLQAPNTYLKIFRSLLGAVGAADLKKIIRPPTVLYAVGVFGADRFRHLRRR